MIVCQTTEIGIVINLGTYVVSLLTVAHKKTHRLDDFWHNCIYDA